MDFVNRLSGQGPRFNMNSAFKFTELSVPVQKHLEKVKLWRKLCLWMFVLSDHCTASLAQSGRIVTRYSQ